jgi:ferredoxin
MPQTPEANAERSTSYEVVLDTPAGQRHVSVESDQYIWDAASAAAIALPAICHQGRCLTCAGRVLGGGQIDQRDAESYYPQDHEAGYILLCRAKPCSALRIRTHVEQEMRDHRLRLHLPAPYA